MFVGIARSTAVGKDTYGCGKDPVNRNCDGGDMDPYPAPSNLSSHPQQTDPSEMDILPEPNFLRIGFAVAPRELLVLIIEDVGLRSSLIARLSLAGESLVTLNGDPADPLLGRIAPPPAILIIDAETVGQRLEALSEGGRWNGIILLTPGAAEPAGMDQVRIVDRRLALAGITETLASWRLAPARLDGS
jgi:hypothetical protein